MKKLLTGLLILISINSFSQSLIYTKQKQYKFHQYHGNRACYDSILVIFDITDTTNSYYDPSTMILNGVQFNSGMIAVKAIDEYYPTQYFTWAKIWETFSVNRKDTYFPYGDNDNKYMCWDDTVGGSGIDKIMTESAANSAIATINTAINGKAPAFTGNSSQYTKGDGTYATFPTIISSESDPTVAAHVKSITTTQKAIWDNAPNLYKPISYSPNNSEVIAALGSTPIFTEVDGSTTNEIQTISLTGSTVNLTSGSSFTLPDASSTNEIELPSQSGNSGKVLTTDGSSVSWTTISVPSNTNFSGSAVSITKQAFATVTPTTGNGYSIDISGVGLSNLVGYSIVPIKSTATATSVPKIAIKSESTSAIVVNIIEGNASTVNILGSLVLLGTSEQFVNVTGLTLKVILYGN